jgi:hypothetical protein
MNPAGTEFDRDSFPSATRVDSATDARSGFEKANASTRFEKSFSARQAGDSRADNQNLGIQRSVDGGGRGRDSS